jgi:predicted DNA-binding transcriptional regulator YafY
MWPRLYKIHHLLLKKRYPSRQELAERLEVSPRTIQRDLDLLRDELGAPIEYDKMRGGYYYTNDQFSLIPLHLNVQEQLALQLAYLFSKQIADPLLQDMMYSAMEKIVYLFPNQVSMDLEEWDGIISSAQDTFYNQQMRGHFLLILNAIEKNQCLEMVYHSFSSQTVHNRRIDPYHLRKSRGTWYLIAYCHKRNSMRMFALQRIHSLRILDETFERQPFDIEDYMKGAFFEERGDQVFEVVLRFSAKQAPYIKERIWHSSQELYEETDGSVILRLQVSGLDSIKRWVLSHGKEVEVIEPLQLKNAVFSEVNELVKQYEKNLRKFSE